MASKAQQALSANLAALSYAMELAGKSEDAPLDIRVASGRRPGPLERRKQDPDIASPDEQSLEYEQGKPLKNLGRLLAYSAGIPLPYNFRQSAEVAEQARIDYENQNTMFGDMADTFLAQMQENADAASDGAETRIYNQYAAQGRDAIGAFFQQDASAEQRTAAWQRLTKLDDEARTVRNSDSNERSKFVRQYLGGELATSRAGLVQLDMAEKDRVMSFESELAQLDNVRPGSTEEQVVLRAMLATGIQKSQDGMATAAKALGGAAEMSRNPYGVAAGAALQVAGSILANETAKLDRETVIKMRLEMNDNMDRLTDEFRPEIVRLHENVASEARNYGIPSASWSSERIKLTTPYADAYRSRLFGQGGSDKPLEGPAPTGSDMQSTLQRYGVVNDNGDVVGTGVIRDLRNAVSGEKRPTR